MSHSPASRKSRPTCPGCGHILHRHGDRRWRCSSCRRTLRFVPRRRGPKKKRGARPSPVQRFLRGRCTIRDLASLRDNSYGTAHERLQRGIFTYLSAPYPPLTWNGSCLVLVADALWLRVGGERVTIYIILLRGTDNRQAWTFVVLPLQGWESEAGWRAALNLIPTAMRQSVIGVTIDGHSGLHAAMENLCGEPHCRPVIQWCQFHCLAELRRRLGKKTIRHDPHTARCWSIARTILDEWRKPQRDIWVQLLALALRNPGCCQRTRLAMRWFLSVVPRVTALFDVPDSSVPATNGSAEAMCKRLRALLNKVRPSTFDRVCLASLVFRRLHPTVCCLKWNITPRFQRIFQRNRLESHRNS